MLTSEKVLELSRALHHLEVEHDGVTSRRTHNEILASLDTFEQALTQADAGKLDPEALPFLRAVAEAGQTWKPTPDQSARLAAVKHHALEIVTRTR